MRAEPRWTSTNEIGENCLHFMIIVQVLLVTGGYNSVELLDSTEILDTQGGSWQTLTTARLPAPRWRLAAGTVNNEVFIFGEFSLLSLFHIQII